LEDQIEMLQLLNQFQETIARRDVGNILNCMRSLADRGHIFSSPDVAQLYEAGQSPVEQSLELAFNWYERSAYEEGDKVGFFGLGRFYFDGRYVEKDTNKSTQLFTQAAALGQIEASILAGFSYLGSRGAKRDLQKAEDVLAPAAEKGYIAAFFLLARVAKARHKYLTAAIFWFNSIYRAYLLSRIDKSDPRLYSLHGIWKT
jgi:TPR repeat protein